MRRLRSDPEFKKRGSKQAREWQLANPVQASWNNSRSSAKKRGYEWQLTRDEYEALVCADCTYCGAPAAPVNGVDRVNNNIGYIASNAATACEHCNYAKRKMTRLDFIKWARRVVAHSGDL